MEPRDWITIIAAVIVVVGWFVNSYLSRQHETAKMRMEHRLECLGGFVPIFMALTDEKQKNSPGINEKLAQARTSFHLYGTHAEIDGFERLAEAIESRDNLAYTSALRDLIKMVREGIRSELGLAVYEYPRKTLLTNSAEVNIHKARTPNIEN